MSDFKVTYKTKNVNSKRLFKEFRTLVEEVSNEYIAHQASLIDRTYNYEELAAFLHMYMDDLIDNNVITQYDVIADHRVNSEVDIHAGRINILVKFRQTNCLNVTEILTTFTLG